MGDFEYYSALIERLEPWFKPKKWVDDLMDITRPPYPEIKYL